MSAILFILEQAKLIIEEDWSEPQHEKTWFRRKIRMTDNPVSTARTYLK